MAIALARIDDRLIHGQVVIGWGVPLGVKLIALIDDDVAANDWEQEIYRMAVPPGVEVEFATRDAAISSLRRWEGDPRTVFVLTGTVVDYSFDVMTDAAPVTITGNVKLRRDDQEVPQPCWN